MGYPVIQTFFWGGGGYQNTKKKTTVSKQSTSNFYVRLFLLLYITVSNKILSLTDCLPADVLLTIFKYLDQRSLGRVAQVSACIYFFKSSRYRIHENNQRTATYNRYGSGEIYKDKDGLYRHSFSSNETCCGSGSGESVITLASWIGIRYSEGRIRTQILTIY
jgi:hypothetical protein